MTSRQLFQIICHALALYFAFSAITTLATAYSASGYLNSLPPEMRTNAFTMYLPSLVQGILAVMLSLIAGRISAAVFPESGVQQSHSLHFAEMKRVAFMGIGIFLLVVGLADLGSYIASQFEPVVSARQRLPQLAPSLVFVVAGLLLAIPKWKGLGNAIADDLWRIKPEDEEPKT